VPFYSIPDSSIKVTDEQLKQYLDKNKSKYKGENTRTIQYVSIPVLPSAQDSSELYQEIKDLAKGLAAAQDDSTFARNNTDVPSNGGYNTMDQVPQELQGEMLHSLREACMALTAKAIPILSISFLILKTIRRHLYVPAIYFSGPTVRPPVRQKH
jgi:hypothetical protein